MNTSIEPHPEPSNLILTHLKKMSHWLKCLPWKRENTPLHSLEESVAELIDEHEEQGAIIGQEERLMLHNLFQIGERTVEDVTMPRSDIVAVPLNTTLEELLQIFRESGHTRLPVYENNMDHIRGFVHIKDVVASMSTHSSFSLATLLRHILFVSPSMKVLDLLKRMRHERVHMAIVLDEYGGTDGLVTLEDLVEEIIGEVEDEHDEDEAPEFTINDQGIAEASGRLSLEEFEHLIGKHNLIDDTEDCDTLGGLVCMIAGKVPAKGEIIKHSVGLEFEILEADPRCIHRIRIRNIDGTSLNLTAFTADNS